MNCGLIHAVPGFVAHFHLTPRERTNCDLAQAQEREVWDRELALHYGEEAAA